MRLRYGKVASLSTRRDLACGDSVLEWVETVAEDKICLRPQETGKGGILVTRCFPRRKRIILSTHEVQTSYIRFEIAYKNGRQI